MSLHEFNDDCPGCKPAIIDPATMQPLPDDSPVMQAVHAVWSQTSFEQRKAFHDVCCLNSRHPHDLELFEEITRAIECALKRE